MANDNGMTRRALLGTAGAASLAALGAAALLPSQAHAAIKDYPAMLVAHNALFNAKKALDNGDTKFGGHRVKAIEFVDSAIAEITAGVDFADGK